VNKKTPNSSPFAVLDRFHNELDLRKIQRLRNAEGPKNTFPELVGGKRLKYSGRRSIHRSASASGMAVHLLPLQHYINRRVGEKLPQSIHCYRVVVLLNFLTIVEACCISMQALRHLRSVSAQRT
jgi:hypothetical protein